MWILTTVALIYTGLCSVLYLSQRTLIYYPTPEVSNQHADDLRLDSGGETIQVWRLSSGNAGAVIYFGGNAEDVSLNTPDFLRHFPEFTVYLVNYRGYGGSTGDPAEESIYADALSVYDFARDHHERISVVGRSLGSGVATYLATERPLERLVLVTPFDSMEQVAKRSFPIFPVSQLLKDKYDSVGRADDIDVPTLLLIAQDDGIIPRKNSDNLAAALDPSLLEIEVIDGARHNTIDHSARYMASMGSFLRGD